MKKTGRFSNQISLVFSLLISFVTLTIGIIISYLYRRSLIEFAENYAIAIAGNVSSEIAEKQNQAFLDLSEIKYIFSSTRLLPDSKLDLVKNKLRKAPYMLFIGIYDTLGAPIDFVTKTKVKPPPLNIKSMNNKHNRYVRVVRTTDSINSPVMEIITPWKEFSHNMGFISMGFSMDWLKELLERLSLQYTGKKYHVFVVDSEGRFIIPQDTFRTTGAYSELSDAFGKNLVSMMHHRLSVSSIYTNFLGEKVFSTLVTLPSTGMGVIIEQPLAVLYTPLKKIQIISLIIALIAILIALGVARFISIRITLPLKQLEKGMEEVAKANFDYTIKIEGNNEIVRVAHEFNEMARRLLHYKNRLIQETRTRAYLQRYLSLPFLAKLMSDGKNLLEEKPAKHYVTVMFVDVADFTSITFELGAQEVAEYLNEFFKLSTEVIFKYDGVVDKFIGDCVLALFGVPINWQGMEKSAVVAAKEIIKRFQSMEDAFERRFGFPIRVKAGISTGEVIVGNIGAPNRMDYTAIGPTVNLASRLEAIASEGEIIIDEATKRALPEDIKTIFMGEHEIKGIKNRVRLYRVV